MIKAISAGIAILAAVLFIRFVHRQPAPVIVMAPPPMVIVPAPAPILRDTLPAIEPRQDAEPVPLPAPRAKPKRKTAAKPLPTQAYSCDTIRWALRTFSRSQIEEYARERGVTGEQKAAAEACMKG